jgi:hypothetical protein
MSKLSLKIIIKKKTESVAKPPQISKGVTKPPPLPRGNDCSSNLGSLSKKSHVCIRYGIFGPFYRQMLREGVTCNKVVVGGGQVSCFKVLWPK